ncbi:group-specific protein [Bacillus sp. AK031]
MKFYVASSFKNIQQVRYISEQLKHRGYIHSYDWTQNERAVNIEELEQIGKEEKQAVSDSDFVVVLLPAGKGSHIELGIALGLRKKVFLHFPNKEAMSLNQTSTFYYLQEVEKCYGSLDDLVDRINSSSNSNK